ncbi:MAG: YbaB/EbfC family nucleoid-associated protein [Firmicutes bacterium]|nr:YbaB/EbfC family nucleoid-associated protein [Bacillota bacterium]MBQ6670104.1 YbaB/EbfC family nucleoid-associated protein [Bacillota bacterium]
MGKGMKAGKKPKMNNQQAQMAQLQAMQARFAAAQEEIEKKEAEAGAGGGAVTVKVNGKHELVSVTIKPEACDPEDVEMLQDMIVAAANEAMRQIDEIAEKEMSGVTGGMGLPGGLF